jgi:hypothetical protein
MAEPSQKSFMGRIGALLFGDDHPSGHPQQRLAAATAPPAAHKSLPDGHALPEKLPAGTMQLIGLGAIHSELGAHWAERAEQIYRLVEGILRRRLDVTDAYYKVDDENYLILFTRLGRREAAFKAKVIADEIQKLVVGELPPEHEVVVSSTVAEVDRALVLQQVESLQDLVNYVRAAAENAKEDGDITFFHQGAEADPEIHSAPAAVTGAGPDLADLDQSLAGLFQKKSVAAFLKECRAGFYPAFSLRRRSFSSYQTAAIHVPTGKRALEVNDPFLEHPDELPLQIDRYLLTTGLLGVHRMLTGGRRGIVVMSVTYDTLAQSKSREIYFARLKEIPEGVTKFLGFSLRDIPAGTPASRIAEVMAYIQPYGQTRLLRVQADARLIDSYAGTGCHGFATWIPQDETDLGRRFQNLSQFTKRAALHRMECVLTEVHSHDDVSTGVAAGFTYLSGDAVAPMLDTPGLSDGLKADHILRHAGN